MTDKLDTWERKEGGEFIERLGLKKEEKVLDFGAGYGHYTPPAAEFLGKRGFVYVVDKKKEPLSAIAEKASDRGLSNIKTVKNTNSVTLKFDPELIDAVFLFDILYYIKRI